MVVAGTAGTPARSAIVSQWRRSQASKRPPLPHAKSAGVAHVAVSAAIASAMAWISARCLPRSFFALSAPSSRRRASLPNAAAPALASRATISLRRASSTEISRSYTSGLDESCGRTGPRSWRRRRLRRRAWGWRSTGVGRLRAGKWHGPPPCAGARFRHS